MKTLEEIPIEKLRDIEKQLVSKVNYENDFGCADLEQHLKETDLLIAIQKRILYLETKNMFNL